MIKFPSIEQFRHIIRLIHTNHDYQGKNELDQPIYQHNEPYPILEFKGTVKLHGTNAAVVLYKDGHKEFQSRERVLTLQQDNAQFMLNMSAKKLDFLFEDIEFDNHIAIFGEWCGQSIQKGVGISELPKMFVIFACNVDGNWTSFTKSDPKQQIYNINDFPTFNVTIDLNQPELIQNKLIELTIAVEEECPVAKSFGVSGIGEGIVFTTNHNGVQYQFKSKGEKHSSSKVIKLNSVDTEKIESNNQFVENVLTEARLNQGIEKLRELQLEVSQKSTGEYLRWIIGDIMKEEEDTIIKNQLDMKQLNPLISKKARDWFFKHI